MKSFIPSTLLCLSRELLNCKQSLNVTVTDSERLKFKELIRIKRLKNCYVNCMECTFCFKSTTVCNLSFVLFLKIKLFTVYIFIFNVTVLTSHNPDLKKHFQGKKRKGV